MENLITYEIEKTTQKQQKIKQIDPLKFQKNSDVTSNLEVDDIMKYIERFYYYFEVHEYNRYLEVIQKKKPKNKILFLYKRINVKTLYWKKESNFRHL